MPWSNCCRGSSARKASRRRPRALRKIRPNARRSLLLVRARSKGGAAQAVITVSTLLYVEDFFLLDATDEIRRRAAAFAREWGETRKSVGTRIPLKVSAHLTCLFHPDCVPLSLRECALRKSMNVWRVAGVWRRLG
jgi:hypothetical protein